MFLGTSRPKLWVGALEGLPYIAVPGEGAGAMSDLAIRTEIFI